MPVMAMRMLDTHDLAGIRVFAHRPRKDDPDALRKLGKVHACVFHPTEKRCIGMLVKRPDAALMFKRSDAFAALGACMVEGKRVVVADEPQAMGSAAEKALGIDLDECVLWVGMPLVSEGGVVLGTVGRVRFEAETGAVIEVEASQGATANALLGQRVVPAEDILGFRHSSGGEDPGAILVSEDAAASAPAEGAAAKAGKATAVAAAKVRQVKDAAQPTAREAAAQAGAAAEKAAFAAGRQIGRATGMFAAFKEEFDKARNGDDEEES